MPVGSSRMLKRWVHRVWGILPLFFFPIKEKLEILLKNQGRSTRVLFEVKAKSNTTIFECTLIC